MSLIQPGQKFRVCANFEGAYLAPGEILTIQTVAPDNTVEFLRSEKSKQKCLSTSLLKHWIDRGKIVLIEEPAKPMPQTATQVEAAMDANARRIRATRGEALDAIGRIYNLQRRDGEPDNVFRYRIHKAATATPEEQQQQDSEQAITAAPVWPAADYSLIERRMSNHFGSSADPYQPRIQMENHPMSKVRIVDVFLFDDTPGLKAEDRLIAKYEGITTDGSDTDVIVDLALNHNIKEKLASHNEKRAKTVNEDLLNRVGKKVMLLPLEAKQIEYRIKPVVQL